MKRLVLSDDGHCFACGRNNPSGLGLDFRHDGGKVTAVFMPAKAHQGFKDIVHGGIITTALDEAMMKAVLSRGIQAVTAEITVRFIRPLHVGDLATIEATITTMGNRLIRASAQMKGPDYGVIADAEAKLLRNG